MFSSSGVAKSLSRKDELFNDLIDECASRGIDFPDSLADVDGKYILQVFIFPSMVIIYFIIIIVTVE